MKVNIMLDSADKVKEFNSIVKMVSFPMDVISGRTKYLDAKSLLGLLSCDLSKPMVLDTHGKESEERELLSKIGEFIVG